MKTIVNFTVAVGEYSFFTIFSFSISKSKIYIFQYFKIQGPYFLVSQNPKSFSISIYFYLSVFIIPRIEYFSISKSRVHIFLSLKIQGSNLSVFPNQGFIFLNIYKSRVYFSEFTNSGHIIQYFQIKGIYFRISKSRAYFSVFPNLGHIIRCFQIQDIYIPCISIIIFR